MAAIGIALFLWLQTALLSLQVEEVSLPIVFDPEPSELILKSDIIPEVSLYLQTKGIWIFLFKQQQIYYQVDGSKLKYGVNSLHLQVDNLTCSDRQLEHIKGFTEKFKLIEMDRIINRQKPVMLTFTSKVDEEFFLEQKLDISSNIVQVKGPENLIESLEHIKTEPVTKKDLKNNQLRVALMSPSHLVELKSDEIVIKFNSQVKTVKTLSLLPIRYYGDRQIEFSPKKLTVKLEGNENELGKLNKDKIKIKLVIPDSLATGYGYPEFELPTGITILEYTPEKIRYSVQ